MSLTITGDWDDINSDVGPETRYVLRLYEAGASVNSVRAIANLKAICEAHLADRYDLEIIDVHLDESIAQRDQIIALPLLVRTQPAPERRLIGDMSDTQKVLRGLGLL
jgi:circadian clock protein KaiB